MRLGIFGGTFNPIHNGHLINARFIAEEFSLDKILFIPSRYPVHKSMREEVTSEDRFEMVRLAIKDFPQFDVSRIEIDRNAPSYTIITVKQLEKEYPRSELFLIIGSDSFDEIDTWKDYRELIARVSILVMARNSREYRGSGILEGSKRVLFAGNPVIDISSSNIREKVKSGLSIKNYVPGTVEEYILNKGIYRN